MKFASRANELFDLLLGVGGVEDVKIGTLRTIKCSLCDKACAIEQLEGEFKSESEMPQAPKIMCFDCAATVIANRAGLKKETVHIGTALIRMLGYLNSPEASLAKNALDIIVEQRKKLPAVKK